MSLLLIKARNIDYTDACTAIQKLIGLRDREQESQNNLNQRKQLINDIAGFYQRAKKK